MCVFLVCGFLICHFYLSGRLLGIDEVGLARCTNITSKHIFLPSKLEVI